MNKFLTFLFVFFCFQFLNCSSGDKIKYHRVKIFTGKEGIILLQKQGLAVDHGEVKKGVFFISDFSSKEIKKIKKTGLKFEIIIRDVNKFYSDSSKIKTKPL